VPGEGKVTEDIGTDLIQGALVDRHSRGEVNAGGARTASGGYPLGLGSHASRGGFFHAPRLLSEAVVDSVNQHSRGDEVQLTHPVNPVPQEHAAVLARPHVPVGDGLRIELLRDRGRHRSQPTRRQTLRARQHRLLVCHPHIGVGKAHSLVEDDLNVSARQSPLAERHERAGESVAQIGGIRHPLLDRAVGYPDRGPQFRGDAPHRHPGVRAGGAIAESEVERLGEDLRLHALPSGGLRERLLPRLQQLLEPELACEVPADRRSIPAEHHGLGILGRQPLGVRCVRRSEPRRPQQLLDPGRKIVVH
jgi:hypothetical protein